MGRSAVPFLCRAANVLTVLVLAITGCTRPQAQEKPTAGFATPQAVFDAYAAAQSKADWKTSWACLTPALQDLHAVEALFALGMHDPAYGEKYLKPEFNDPEKEVEPGEEPQSEEEEQKMLLSALRDKFTVYAAAQEMDAKDDEPIDWKAPLRKLEVDGDRARGVVTRYLVSTSRSRGEPQVTERTPWDMAIYFQKTDKGWLLDRPTQAESLRDAREIERGDGDE